MSIMKILTGKAVEVMVGGALVIVEGAAVMVGGVVLMVGGALVKIGDVVGGAVVMIEGVVMMDGSVAVMVGGEVAMTVRVVDLIEGIRKPPDTMDVEVVGFTAVGLTVTDVLVDGKDFV